MTKPRSLKTVLREAKRDRAEISRLIRIIHRYKAEARLMAMLADGKDLFDGWATLDAAGDIRDELLKTAGSAKSLLRQRRENM